MTEERTTTPPAAAQPKRLYVAPRDPGDQNLAERVATLEATVEKLDRLVYRLYKKVQDLLVLTVLADADRDGSAEEPEPAA